MVLGGDGDSNTLHVLEYFSLVGQKHALWLTLYDSVGPWLCGSE